MTTEIYVVRHGQSMGNLNDLFIGHTDIALTSLGYQQAEATAAFFENIPVDAIYASDLQRAKHTAQATADRKGLPVIADPDLREVYGGQWEEMVFYTLKDHSPDAFRAWEEDFGNCSCPDGESIAQLQHRLDRAMERIVKSHPGQTVCVFSHAAAIRTLTAHWAGLSLEEMNRHPWPSNASISHGRYKDGKFSLVEYSIDHHLGDLKSSFFG